MTADHLQGVVPAGPRDLKRAVRRHPAGVAVVTVATPQGPAGFTATSLASASADPPMLSFNVSRSSSVWPQVEAARHVAVHLLTEEQEDLAVRFAARGADRFAPPTVWAPGPFGVPVLGGVSAWLVGEVEGVLPAGGNAVVVARVLHVETPSEPSPPLVHHDGRYRRLVPDRSRLRLVARDDRT